MEFPIKATAKRGFSFLSLRGDVVTMYMTANDAAVVVVNNTRAHDSQNELTGDRGIIVGIYTVYEVSMHEDSFRGPLISHFYEKRKLESFFRSRASTLVGLFILLLLCDVLPCDDV